MSENFRKMLAYAFSPVLAHQPQHLSGSVESEDSDVVHTMVRVTIADKNVQPRVTFASQ